MPYVIGRCEPRAAKRLYGNTLCLQYSALKPPLKWFYPVYQRICLGVLLLELRCTSQHPLSFKGDGYSTPVTDRVQSIHINVSESEESPNNSIRDLKYQLNPSGHSPLTANIQFSTKNNSSAKITIHGDDPIVIESKTPTSSQSINLIGLYANTEKNISLSINKDEKSILINKNTNIT